MSAGGLRSSAVLGSALRGESTGACRLGTDSCDRLETAKRECAGANFRRSRAPVLGSEACRGGRFGRDCKAAAAPAGAGMLHPERILLGRSHSLSSQSRVESSSGIVVLERPRAGNNSQPGKGIQRPTLRPLKIGAVRGEQESGSLQPAGLNVLRQGEGVPFTKRYPVHRSKCRLR